MKESWTEKQRRMEAWLKECGLQKSRASHTKVLSWIDRWTLPAGFDHTRVFYSPKRKLYILITEPYHSTRVAELSLDKLDRKVNIVPKGYVRAYGKPGSGLHNPGQCHALLVCKWEYEKGNNEYLEFCANAL